MHFSSIVSLAIEPIVVWIPTKWQTKTHHIICASSFYGNRGSFCLELGVTSISLMFYVVHILNQNLVFPFFCFSSIWYIYHPWIFFYCLCCRETCRILDGGQWRRFWIWEQNDERSKRCFFHWWWNILILRVVVIKLNPVEAKGPAFIITI